MIYSANTFKAPSSSDACGASIVMHDVRGTPDNAVNLYIAPSTTTTTTTTIKKQTTTSTSKKTTLSTKSPSFSSGQPSPTLTPCNEMCVNSCIYNSTLACTRDHTCVKVNPGDKSCCPSYHCVKNSTFTASTTQLAHTTTNKKTITTSIRTSTKKTSTTSLKVLEG